jgi:sugar-phosphatase
VIFSNGDWSFGALICDMDGTLVDSHVPVAAVWESWAAKEGLDPDEVRIYGEGRRPEETIRHFRPEATDVAAQAAQIQADEVALTEGIVEVPGAGALLDGIGQRDGTDQRPKWALVTSATTPLAKVRIGVAGLPWPKIAVCGEHVARGKPAPDGYLAAAHTLGVPIDDCLILEDSPAGIEAALASGGALIVVGAPQPAEHPRWLATVPDLTSVSVRPGPDGRLVVSVAPIRAIP